MGDHAELLNSLAHAVLMLSPPIFAVFGFSLLRRLLRTGFARGLGSGLAVVGGILGTLALALAVVLYRGDVLSLAGLLLVVPVAELVLRYGVEIELRIDAGIGHLSLWQACIP